MQEFTCVSLDQRRELYQVLRDEVFKDLEIKPAMISMMISALSKALSVELANEQFLKDAGIYRDNFHCLDVKKRREFLNLLESSDASLDFSKLATASDLKNLAVDLWKLVLCYQAQAEEAFRNFQKHINTIAEKTSCSQLLDLHRLYHLGKSNGIKIKIHNSQLARYRVLITYYVQYIVTSSRAPRAPLNFADTSTNLLLSFSRAVGEMVNEFAKISDIARSVMFAKLIQEGDADCLDIIRGAEEYDQQHSDLVNWGSIAHYWRQLVTLINDPEASEYFNAILVTGIDKLILSPEESLSLQQRVKFVLISKIQDDDDQEAELERTRQDNDTLRTQLAEKEQELQRITAALAAKDQETQNIRAELDRLLAQLHQQVPAASEPEQKRQKDNSHAVPEFADSAPEEPILKVESTPVKQEEVFPFTPVARPKERYEQAAAFGSPQNFFVPPKVQQHPPLPAQCFIRNPITEQQAKDYAFGLMAVFNQLGGLK